MSLFSRIFSQGHGEAPSAGSGGDAGLIERFTEDHRACDEQWADVEAAAGDAIALGEAWRRFDASMRRHLAMEEDVLFPAFEQASGMTTGGPTFVMRAEHMQMRGLLDRMAQALAGGDERGLLDQGDTLLMLIQQHNSKEEGMLYPMASQILARDWPAIRERLAAYAPE